MNTFFRTILVIAGLVVFLGGCVSTTGTLTTAFEPAEAAFSQKPGKATVTGQGFLRRNDGVVVYAAGSEVVLIPKTRYSDERMAQIYGTGKEAYFGKTFTNDDPRFQSYVRKTIADGEGRFTFESIPDGQYYVATSVMWMAGNMRQGGAIMERVTVSGGKAPQVIMSGM